MGADMECIICRCELETVEESNGTSESGLTNDVDVESSVFRLTCGHTFHKTCVEQWFSQKMRCPMCQWNCGRMVGDQPRTGSMSWKLELFRIAFRRCVMFGLGTSMALRVFRPTFNIHLKTKTHSGETAHGYPDALYFRRCLEELQ